MIEGKLGGIIYYNDKGNIVALKVVESSECTGCYFRDKDCGYCECRVEFRKDNKDVHFIELKEVKTIETKDIM